MVVLEIAGLALTLRVEVLVCMLAVESKLLAAKLSVARGAHAFSIVLSLFVLTGPDLNDFLPVLVDLVVRVRL
jgi:hypothetical protein